MPVIKAVKGGFHITHTTREVFGVDDPCDTCGVDHGAQRCPKLPAHLHKPTNGLPGLERGKFSR